MPFLLPSPTPLLSTGLCLPELAAFAHFILERNPLGRIGDPLEVCGQVIVFAAPAGSYMTGQIVYIDGGVTASQ